MSPDPSSTRSDHRSESQAEGFSSSPEDTLAFLRSVVADETPAQKSGGLVYCAAGLLYGTQCLFHWGQLAGLIHWSGIATLVFVLAISLAFAAVLFVAIRRDQKTGVPESSVYRASNAAFQATGLANLAMMAVFGVNAFRMGSFEVWLLYPPVVFALQGGAWFVAFRLRRRRWMAWIAAGWMLAAIALGFANGNQAVYLALCTASLFGLMALPGWILFRHAARQSLGGS